MCGSERLRRGEDYANRIAQLAAPVYGGAAGAVTHPLPSCSFQFPCDSIATLLLPFPWADTTWPIQAHLQKPMKRPVSCLRRSGEKPRPAAPPRKEGAEAAMASGVEEAEERARREVAGEEEPEEDRPQLGAAASAALREFLEEQLRHEREEGEAGEGGAEEGGVELVTEDWRLSQFWYDDVTARALAEEVARLVSGLPGPAAVACVACPTLYAYLKKTSPDVPAQLLEYDERFGQYGSEFTFYDYNQPEELPPAMKHAYRIVVADPPYLSRECLEKVAKTVSFLAPPEGSFLLLLTGEVQKERAAELLNVRPCGFKPRHSNKLGNEFRLFTNYDPAERLGGWEQSDGAPI